MYIRIHYYVTVYSNKSGWLAKYDAIVITQSQACRAEAKTVGYDCMVSLSHLLTSLLIVVYHSVW